MGVLVHAQLKQRGEDLAAEVAAVRQLLLVGPDVLQELVQLLEGLGARLQHTLVNLQHNWTRLLDTNPAFTYTST